MGLWIFKALALLLTIVGLPRGPNPTTSVYNPSFVKKYNGNFFAHFFGESILKILTSVPGVCGRRESLRVGVRDGEEHRSEGLPVEAGLPERPRSGNGSDGGRRVQRV
jgi:hypothetical protein